MTLIYLLRHAESIANKEEILAGRVDGISLSKAGKAGKGLYAFESGDLAEVDEELAQSMLDDFKKWAADPNWSKGGKGEKYLKMANVLEKMLKEKE